MSCLTMTSSCISRNNYAQSEANLTHDRRRIRRGTHRADWAAFWVLGLSSAIRLQSSFGPSQDLWQGPTKGWRRLGDDTLTIVG
jgi:hypothetical protein